MHHFISYSHADAENFALKLADSLVAGPPMIRSWIDQRDIRSGEDWDVQIDYAIKTCETLIFVMTIDSVADTSECKNEWVRALKYKKPIIPVQIDPNSALPYGLGRRQYIDFSSSFESGLARLRRHLLWLQTTKGRIQQLKYRLADAERDLRRPDTDRNRVEKEIGELKAEIDRLESINVSPETAILQSDQSIKTRILSERQSVPKTLIEKRAKFVNPPPMLVPAFFQDRFIETGLIADFLKNESQRILTLIGRGGIGKTAMVCRLLKSLERGELPDGLGSLALGGIVYLSEGGTHQIKFSNFFEDLCSLLPHDTADHLEQVFKDSHRSVRSKMLSLLEGFQDEPVVVLFDNLEYITDPKTQCLIQEDLREALTALLEAPHHTVKIIITTRIPPQDILLIQPVRQQRMVIDGGLNSPYAENLLRAYDSDGTLGLRDAPNQVLNEVREHTRGFPRALEAFYGILAADRSTSLEELLVEIKNTLPQYIVEKLVGEGFSRLDSDAQMVMQALAIFGRPVPPVAVDFLLQPYITAPDSARILKRLVNMHFVRLEHGRYYLHPVDLSYALELIPQDPVGTVSDAKISFSRQVLRSRASNYFMQIRRPREEWQSLADIEPQLAEFELRLAAEDYETALSLINDVDRNYLERWGHSGMLAEMRKKLIGNLRNDYSVCRNLTGLGQAYLAIGKSNRAIDYGAEALAKSQNLNDIYLEAQNMNTLAIAYRRLGKISRAIDLYEKSLAIDRKVATVWNEAINLNNLAVAFRYLGLVKKAVNYHEQAREIQRRLHDIRNEGVSIGTQAVCLRYLGQLREAVEFSIRALNIAVNEKDRHWEAYHLAELGCTYLDCGDLQKGTEYLDKALEKAREIADGHFEAVWTVRHAVRELFWGKPDVALQELKRISELYDEEDNSQYKVDVRLARTMAELRVNLLEDALETIRPVLDTEYGLCKPEIMALHGILLLRIGKPDEARERFTATMQHADSLLAQTIRLYTALEAKGVAACGIAICQEENAATILPTAIRCYRDARGIITAPGVVHRALFFFEECAKADTKGLLADVRSEVIGKNT